MTGDPRTVAVRLDEALRERVWDALIDPRGVACAACGAEQWTACKDGDDTPHSGRQADAVLAVLAEGETLTEETRVREVDAGEFTYPALRRRLVTDWQATP